MKKNTTNSKLKKPKSTAFVLLVWLIAFSAFYALCAFLFLTNDYATWRSSCISTVERTAYSNIQRFQQLAELPASYNPLNNFSQVLGSDVHRLGETADVYVRVTDRTTGKQIADSGKRIYLVLPNEDVDPKQDDPSMLNILYTCDSREIMEWMEQTEAAGINSRDEYINDQCHIVFRLKDYELGDDGSFLPKQIIASDVNATTGQEKLIGVFTYPKETKTVDESTWVSMSDPDPYLYILGGDLTADDFPLWDGKSLPDTGYNVSRSESHTYQYGREINEAEYYSKSFWKGDFVYIRNLPFVVSIPGENSFESATIVYENENGQVSVISDAASRNLVLEFYYKSNYREERMNELLFRGLIYYLPLLIISSIIVTLIHRRKVVKYEKESFRRTLTDSMSHDLKSPLTALRGYAESLKENLNTEKKEEYADAILDSSEYMDRLISGNMELLKLEDMGAIRNKEDVDLVKVAEELFEKYKPALNEKGITLIITGNFQRKANKELITSALENLVSNTVKYTSENGSITLLGTKNSLTLSNSAISIPDRKPEELWESFVKGDDSRSGENGSGLGLAIAKRIFDKHKIKSKIKYGANNLFCVELA